MKLCNVNWRASSISDITWNPVQLTRFVVLEPGPEFLYYKVVSAVWLPQSIHPLGSIKGPRNVPITTVIAYEPHGRQQCQYTAVLEDRGCVSENEVNGVVYVALPEKLTPWVDVERVLIPLDATPIIHWPVRIRSQCDAVRYLEIIQISLLFISLHR